MASSSRVSNETNNEIKKRRQMRLQQVRQQSKDIAQNIRDKVKKEHEKQISQASHDNAIKLKQWQNQKLLQLQNQYQEGVDNIGLGHIQAAREGIREDNALVEQEKRKKDAKDRGFQASQKLQIAKNEQNMKKALPRQQKKFAREIENARASLVSKVKNTSSEVRENQKQVETASSPTDTNASDYENPTDETPTSDTGAESMLNSDVVTNTITSPRKHGSKDLSPLAKGLPTKPVIQSSIPDAAISQIQEPANVVNDPSNNCTAEAYTRPFYLDTRISDRIKSRLIPLSESRRRICGSSYASEYAPAKTTCCPCPERSAEERASESEKDNPPDLDSHDAHNVVNSKSTIPKSAVSDNMTSKSTTKQPKASQRTTKKTTSNLSQPTNSRPASEKVTGIEVPFKPPVALIPSNETLSHLHSLPQQPTNISRVQYYDHRNRYNTEYLTDNTNIQKIADENLVQLADSQDIVIEHTELMLRRDREAQMRGQKALEKERIHREYNELLQKLPVLQKKERIACLCRDKPTFHMTKERLIETEIKRQNIMENAYENLFSNEAKLPPKVKVIPDPNNLPFVTIHNPESTSMRFVAENKSRESQTGLNENQTNLLKILLENLQQQKQMLQQLGSIPEEQTLNNIASASNEDKKSSKRDIHKMLSECECIPLKALILQNTSTQTSPAQTSRTSRTSRTSTSIAASSPKRPHRSTSLEADESTSPKKPKKTRNKDLTDVTEAKNKFTRGSIKTASLRTSKIASKSIPSSENTDSSMPVRVSKQRPKCDCKTQADCDQLCEIRIRIQENEKPEIIISSPKKTRTTREEIPSKPMLNVPSHIEPSLKPVLQPSSHNDRKRSKIADKGKPKRVAANKTPITWGEHFTQNSSSSSTTYYSPPTMQNSNSIKPKLRKGSVKSKSATDSAGGSNKQIDRRLMAYITKLLDLSKAQIDELNVSSVSEVTTPSSSIIESSNNRPMKQLMNVMKLFKLSPLDIATNLNYSKDNSPVASNNSNSTSGTSRGFDASKSLQSEPVKIREQYGDSTTSSKYYSDNSKSTNEFPTGFTTKYAEMADICHQRITDLTAEIEKIRQEKQQILESHSESDKENSTVYCNLPSKFGHSTNQDISPHSLEEQEQLNKILLRTKIPITSVPNTADIDYEAFFEGVDDVDKDIMDRYIKLKTDINKLIVDVPESEEPPHILSVNIDNSRPFSPQLKETKMQLKNDIIQQTNPPKDFRDEIKITGKNVIFNVDNADQDILDEISNDKSINKLVVSMPQTSDKNNEDPEIRTELRQDLFFIPLLNDIPRLPKLGTPNLSEVEQTFQGKRPPPSKGLIAARRFKGDMIAPPHELSTIAEADSLISTKLNIKQTPDGSYVESYKGDVKETDSCSSEESMPDLLAELIGKVNVTDDLKGNISKRSDTDTSTEKSDLETIENMLRSIGMDWAITTLRKTREALGRNSSSSTTTEISIKQLDCQNNDSISGVEGSTIGSCSSIAASQYSCESGCSAFCNDIDLSQISGGTSNTIDKGNRTSTPVQTSKRKSKSGGKDVLEVLEEIKIFTADSDPESVHENTDDHYLTIPDISLKSHNRTEHR